MSNTPTTAEVRDYFTHGQFSDVPEPEGVARFNRWLTKHDAEQAVAASRPIVHFDDDHEECARELAEVQRKLVTAKAVAASAEETTRAYREQAAATRTATLEEAAELLRREAHRVAQLKILRPDYRQALVDTFYEASRVVTRAAKDGAQ